MRVAEPQGNKTPFEPEQEGFVTLEISSATPLPAKVYANQGLCQILLFRSDDAFDLGNNDCKGKHRRQHGIVVAKLGNL